ncbi:hypothetical protein A8C32_10410 [Flavivirga aquatica]|uniref:Molecular chaperone Skp n=1 Tax=Flavivirga aquatica TaxID=1849968 RepID=A0A1E5TCQ3_9FLAO|nr:OmpH family outer membrane protein [Flavivirga aquatica]OEK09138.1 hypothetical protein A8C32_10410 [Flavivirga aquatica]
MNNLNRLTIINTVLILTIIVIALVSYLRFNNKEEIVYVNNVRLFNGFNMTKDIKTTEETKINKQAKELDLLYVKLKSLTEEEQSLNKNLQQQIAYKSKALQELQDNYTHNLSQNVWKRLNDYIKEYAKTRSFKIIVGTSGNGNVMFAEESIDITNEILEFSNKKYEGN